MCILNLKIDGFLLEMDILSGGDGKRIRWMRRTEDNINKYM
jgi:hypothetical protein